MVYDALMVGYIAFRKTRVGQPMALRPGAMTHEGETGSDD